MLPNTLEHVTVKSTLYIHLILTPDAHMLVRLALRSAISKIQHIQGHQKSEMHRMTPN